MSNGIEVHPPRVRFDSVEPSRLVVKRLHVHKIDDEKVIFGNVGLLNSLITDREATLNLLGITATDIAVDDFGRVVIKNRDFAGRFQKLVTDDLSAASNGICGLRC